MTVKYIYRYCYSSLRVRLATCNDFAVCVNLIIYYMQIKLNRSKKKRLDSRVCGNSRILRGDAFKRKYHPTSPICVGILLLCSENIQLQIIFLYPDIA